MRQLPENLAQGQAGVYTVAAQLLLRGIDPSFPAVDIGYDLIADGNIKVQVKSAHLGFKNAFKTTKAGAGYAFKLATRAVVSKHVVQKRVSRIFSQECDFVVLWGIEENRFWIVPAQLLDGKVAVYVGPKCSWVSTDFLALKEAKLSGKTYREIAKENNINLATAYNTINGKREQGERAAFTQELRSYEDRWDLLEQLQQEIDIVDGAFIHGDGVVAPEVSLDGLLEQNKKL